MSSPPPTRPTSHRAATRGAALTRRLLPSLAAVTAVVLVILLLIVLNSRPTPPGPAPGAVAQSADSDGANSPTASPSPTATVTPSASVAPPPVSPPPATQAPATQPPAQPATAAVTVLNNSRRHGLAAHVAGELEARGWSVPKTGNFTGRIAETTVYYAPGQRAVALRLAREFGQIQRVLPRLRGLPGSGLTLVVTRTWTG